MIFVSYFEVEEKLVRLLQKQISFFEKAFRWSPKIIGGREQKKNGRVLPKKLVVLWEKNSVLEQQSQNQHQRHQHGV